MAYVDIEYVKLVGTMPAHDIDALEALTPGTFSAIASSVSRIFDARLFKRYKTPFVEPVPEVVRWHVAHVVVAALWKKRGFNPGSEQDALIERAKDEALAWLKEAADSKEGLVELPIREATPDATGVVKGGPIADSEATPYEWVDKQSEAADGR
jgi:hypothetical protein